MRSGFKLLATLVIGLLMFGATGCHTAPKGENRTAFIADSKTARQWFEDRTPGLKQQINNSAGYVVYPDVAQWGILFLGGKFGRGTVCKPDGTQIGWGAVNTGSLGLQAGVQGFKMLVIFENDPTLDKFKKNELTGSVSAVAVAAETGGSGTGKFENGVVVYQGANTGLMAGVNVGLDYMRFKSMEDEAAGK
jgi:lipid-binding SYLF domain-containing protein